MITPSAVLECAGTLMKLPYINEAIFRTIIGRAYYAAYYKSTAWAVLRPQGGLPNNFRGGQHKEFTTRLKNPSPQLSEADRKRSVELGVSLAALHGLRIKADYDTGSDVGMGEAFQALADASAIIKSL